MLDRHLKRKAPQLEALRAAREEKLKIIREEKKRMDEMMHEQALAEVASGRQSLYSATGLTAGEIVELAEGGSRRVSRRKLLPKAYAVIDSALGSGDEKVALVAAKLAVEMSEETAEELASKQDKNAAVTVVIRRFSDE
jgi:hypothetical protein